MEYFDEKEPLNRALERAAHFWFYIANTIRAQTQITNYKSRA